jgi:hypothetical protein
MIFISWFNKFFGKIYDARKHYVNTKAHTVIRSFPKARGYIVNTAEGGRFECVSQYTVADTLEALYNKDIRRGDIAYALTHKGGILVKDSQYIATIKYKKEK